MDFKHFILTRFNLGIYDNNSAYAEKIKDPDRWMAHRVELFERYCLPSVMKQTCQDFTWVIAFDPKTESRYIEQYDYFPFVQVCFEQPHLWLKRRPSEADWLITSRFDNDDQYRPEFVKRVQQAFDHETEVIDIDYDVMDSHSGKRYRSMRIRPNSPFLSLVEPWERDPKTALGRPHTVMCDLYPARKIGLLATQVIHDRNICNKVTEVEL